MQEHSAVNIHKSFDFFFFSLPLCYSYYTCNSTVLSVTLCLFLNHWQSFSLWFFSVHFYGKRMLQNIIITLVALLIADNPSLTVTTQCRHVWFKKKKKKFSLWFIFFFLPEIFIQSRKWLKLRGCIGNLKWEKAESDQHIQGSNKTMIVSFYQLMLRLLKGPPFPLSVNPT